MFNKHKLIMVVGLSLVIFFNACAGGQISENTDMNNDKNHGSDIVDQTSDVENKDSSNEEDEPTVNPKPENPTIKPEDIVDFVLDVEDNRPVRILQLTDIQIIDSSQCRSENRLSEWGMKEWAPDKMESVAFENMRQIVNRTKPDLIVLTGDNVYGEFDDNGSVMQKLVAEMESYNIPWTAIFGNHDNESKKGVAWQCQQYENAPHCMFTRKSKGEYGKKAQGNCNFTIGIRQGGKIMGVLVMLDSHGCDHDDEKEEVYRNWGIFDSQLEWVEYVFDQLRKSNSGKDVKKLSFFHHTPYGYGEAMRSKYGYASITHGITDKNGVSKGFRPIFIDPDEYECGDSGHMAVDVGNYMDKDGRFKNLMLEYGGEGMFFGHDHKNNCSVEYQGIRYVYGLKAGKYDAYNKGETGGTLIVFDETDKLKVEHCYYDENYIPQ